MRIGGKGLLRRGKGLGRLARRKGKSAFGKLRDRTGKFAFSGGTRRASALGRRALGRKVRGGVKAARRTANVYGSRVSSAMNRQKLTKSGAIAAALVAGSLGGGAYLASRDKRRGR